MDAAYVDRGLNNYEHRWVFGPGSSFWYGGNLTKDRFGYKTCVMELTGQGCRSFEDGDIMAINAFRRFKGHPEDVTASQVLLKCASADGDLSVPEDLGDYFARGNGSEA